MMEPSISAVLFVYNEAEYIEEMILSIQNQAVDIAEIIVIDDFSTDNTAQIIYEIARNEPKIIYRLNDKKGKVFAYLKGLSLVTSDYFFICAGDDLLSQEFAETLLNKYILKEKMIFCYALYLKLFEDGSTKKIKRKSVYYFRDFIKGKSNPVSGYLFGRSIIIKDILKNVDPKVGFEDWITAIILAKKYGSVPITHEPLFWYRQHKGNVSKIETYKVALRNLRLMDFVENKVLDNSNVYEKRIVSFNKLKWTYYYLLNRLLEEKRISLILFKLFIRYPFLFKDTIAIILKRIFTIR